MPNCGCLDSTLGYFRCHENRISYTIMPKFTKK
jgi:hypothetical protein